MGLLDNLNNLGLGDLVAGAANLLQDTDGDGQIQAVQLVQQLTQQFGGVDGLLKQLGQTDLSNVSNIINVLGNEQLQNAATKVGLNTDQATQLLGQYLPQILPNLPNLADGFGVDDVMSLASKFFK